MDLDRILKPNEIVDRLKYAETQCVKGYYYVLIRPDVRDRIIELLKKHESIITCKDCVNSRTSRCPCHHSGDPYIDWDPDDDWFCADGKRR